MTVVEGSVADIGLKPMSGTLWARPVSMRREGDTVITTERTPFTIEDGDLVDVDLVPGPAQVTIEVGSHVRRDFRVTVPDDGPVQLADLLEDAYEYTPEVVSVVAGYRNDAAAAHRGAAQARAAAEGFKNAAGGSATAANTSAGDAAKARGQAVTARERAEKAQGLAEDARDDAQTAQRGAETAEQNTSAALPALTTRLDEIEHPVSGKADLLGGRLDMAQMVGPPGSGAPIIHDTSVGERFFIGETMIYGDTGWRDMSHLLTEDWDLNTVEPRCEIRRVDERVWFELRLRYVGSPFSSRIDILTGVPAGFRGQTWQSLASVVQTFATTPSEGILSFRAASSRLDMRGVSLAEGNQVVASGVGISDDSWPDSITGAAGF